MADTTITIGSQPEINDPQPPRVSFNFPEKGEIQPEGMDGIRLNDRVTVVLTGTVASMSSDTGRDWASRSISIDVDSCRFEGEMDYDEGEGLGYAVSRTRQRV